MNVSRNLLTEKFVAFLLLLPFTASTLAQNQLPIAAVRNVTDDYFGQKIVDPYRWMEDLKSDEMQKWMRGQADYAGTYLKKLPLREEFFKRLNELSDAGANVDDVTRRGDRYFYYKFQPGENNRKLYMRDGLTGAERLLVDPEKYAVNGGQSTISTVSVSPNGKLLAFLIALGGGEFGTIRVIDVATGKETGDVIENTRFTAGKWTQDSKAFARVKFQTLAADAPTTEKYQKIRLLLHKLGTKTDTDKSLFGYGVNPNISIEPTLLPNVVFPPEAKYAVAYLNSGVSSEVYVAPMDSINQAIIPWRKIIGLEDEVSKVEQRGDDVYFLTSKNTPRYKVMRVNLSNLDLKRAEIVFSASEAVIEKIAATADALCVQTLDGGSRRVYLVDYKTLKQTEVKTAFPSSLSIQDASLAGGTLLLNADSWTRAYSIYEYNTRTKTMIDTELAPASAIDMSNIEVKNFKVRTDDGAMIPMVTLYKKGLKMNGANPVLMDGYGSYGVENTSPFFITFALPWMERGGVYVFTGVRGGGEYGEEWHLAGKGATKPNTWKDFISCAEYLIKEKYTSPAHLGIEGTSAGGILISNALATRPELFAAAINQVGINNALRFETTANGVPNIPEFGSVKTAEGFRNLLAMDGYQKIKKGVKYPATLLTHGANDPRVEPWMSAKMAARLQAATASGRPILLRLDYDAGHGIGSSRKQQNEQQADIYAFLFEQLGAIK